MEVSDLAKLEVRSFPKEDCCLTMKNKDNFSLFKRLKILYLRCVEDNMIIWNYELS